jgi:hypothetical protein
MRLLGIINVGLRFSQRCLGRVPYSVIITCTPLKVKRRFGGTYRLHLQGRRISQTRNQFETVTKIFKVHFQRTTLHYIMTFWRSLLFLYSSLRYRQKYFRNNERSYALYTQCRRPEIEFALEFGRCEKLKFSVWCFSFAFFLWWKCKFRTSRTRTRNADIRFLYDATSALRNLRSNSNTIRT